ncbi:DUF6368 family protein [Streptomyces sp. Amel2xC10]|uniref:DUF6368 family protein n=1 Tax=Streptomyces sp. Amel2xC10 TaxID=1305826 RepID=UPI0035677439
MDTPLAIGRKKPWTWPEHGRWWRHSLAPSGKSPTTRGGGDRWIRHVGDLQFLSAWLQHPNFRLVK